MSRLLLVGWDAADWKVIDPLLAAGEMPHLANLLEAGVRGNVATLNPPLSPMLWTSIATGKRPPKHGIYGFTEPGPGGLTVQPIGILGRKTKALWNILHQSGKRSVVVGWWPSHPAEPIRGAMVSDLFPFRRGQESGAPMLAGAVSPPRLAESIADLRVHPSEVTGGILKLFVPEAERIDQEKDSSIRDLAHIIAETMSIHAAATELLETEEWDFAGVYYSGIDHFCHRFMRYHAGKRGGREGAGPMLAGVVKNAYRYHDVMLGRLLHLAGPECAVMLVSDHGFHSDRLLPDYIPAEAAGPAVEHRQFGIFCLRAPGVAAGRRVYGATILDFAPTALHVMGLPAGLDMDGKVLLNAFSDGRPAAKIATWDDVPGDDGRHPPDIQIDGAAAAESLRQLVDLGYIAPPAGDSRKSVEECLAEQRYNLALAQADAGRGDLAAALLEELIAGDPEQGRYYTALADCLLQLQDFSGCRRLLDRFDRACADFAPPAAAELKRRRADKTDREAGETPTGKGRREVFERRQLAEKAEGFAMQRLFLRCRLALSQRSSARQRERARQLLEQLAATRRRPAGLDVFLAHGFAALKEPNRAIEYIRKALRASRDNPEALALAARLHFQARRYESAVETGVESLSLVYAQPWLHHLVGVALGRLGERRAAEKSLRTALALAPEFAPALEALGRLMSRDRARVGEGSLMMARAAELRKTAKTKSGRRATQGPPAEDLAPSGGLAAWNRVGAPPLTDRSAAITIVAGLPRTGTSMMMQMLAAAGVAAYTDGARLADSDNPRGYLEHENATRLHRDAEWIPQTRGKAVKLIAHLIPYLPAGEQYRIVFMHRGLDAVVASQRAMLDRLGRKGANLTPAAMKRVYTQQLVQVQTWLKRHPEIAVISVDYADALSDPRGVAARLAGFLGEPFDIEAAAAAVEPSLQRQREPRGRSGERKVS